MDAGGVDRWLDRHPGPVDPGVTQRVRIVAMLYGGTRVSGQTLAEALGVSRAAVHKHVEALRELGMRISAEAGSGYRLDAPTDLVCAEAVLPLLAGTTGRLGLPYRYEPSTASTNTIARSEAAAGSPHGTLVVTDYQHTGRGRLGRTWSSEAGKDLTFSVLLRPDLPPERAPRLTLAASVAVAETLASLEGLDGRITIKWPNDILIDGRKVCGILSEASLDMDALHWAVVGIGLNVNGRPAEGLDEAALPHGAALPISVREARGDPCPRAPLLARLLDRLDGSFSLATARGWDRILTSFTGMDALLGREVEVSTGGGTVRLVAAGVARGVGPEGELLVEDASGRIESVVSGDVTLRTAGARAT